MKHLNRTSLALAGCWLCLTFTACATSQRPMGDPESPYPPPDRPNVGDIYHLPTGIKVNSEEFQAAITDARIVYVGETHDNPASHRLELEVLKAVAERYPQQASLGMEMFNSNQQEALDQWISGKLSEKEFLRKSAWFDNWSMDYAYYRDILNFARERGIRVIGLNATRELVRAVGMHAPGELPAELREQLPDLDLEDPYQEAMTRAIFMDHSHGGKHLEGFLRVQTLWDEIMAENVVKSLSSEGPEHHMVVMAGGNHIRYGFGIPRRAYRRLPTSYVLVGSIELNLPEEKRDRLMDVDLPHFPMPPFDYMVYTEYESLPGERAKLGISMKDEEGRVVVESVAPGSTADKTGLVKGDRILALGKADIGDSFDLIYQVHRYFSGDQTVLVIERDGERLEYNLTFAPLPAAVVHGR